MRIFLPDYSHEADFVIECDWASLDPVVYLAGLR